MNISHFVKNVFVNANMKMVLVQYGGREVGVATNPVDHHEHDGLRHEVAHVLADDTEVGLHQVLDGLHLSLQLWVHRTKLGLCNDHTRIYIRTCNTHTYTCTITKTLQVYFSPAGHSLQDQCGAHGLILLRRCLGSNRVDAGAQEGGLPVLHVLFRLRHQLQLVLVLVDVPGGGGGRGGGGSVTDMYMTL